ncbi:MAG: SCO family protein [Xanthomonadales bacterium]|nr:SCO family protein [Xanthomonadales bacterium]MDL1868982.1 SCO family protein [Gammaproteobacteria bacterium PRO6]
MRTGTRRCLQQQVPDVYAVGREVLIAPGMLAALAGMRVDLTQAGWLLAIVASACCAARLYRRVRAVRLRAVPPPRPRHAWALALALLGVAGAASATDTTGRTIAGAPALDAQAAVRTALDAVGHAVPDLELRDRRNQPVRLSAYRGKPLLVSFIYTGCFQICPTQTRTLYQAVKGLDRMLGENQFNVVSIGFNQPFDSPGAMQAFAAQHGISYRNWEFLSPAAHDVDALTRAFGFSFAATPAGFDHVLGVTVVDAQGRISAQVLGDTVTTEQLGSPLRQLLLWEPVTPTSTVADLLERVRILCTVYDAETGQYRYDYKLIFELISGVLFFLSVFVYFLREWLRQRRARRKPCPPASTPSPSGSKA